MAETINKKPAVSVSKTKTTKPALTPEARERELVSMAFDHAEKQFRDGTATSQLTTHFLKLGTLREEIELEVLKNKNLLAQAQVEKIKSDGESKRLLEKAMKAFSSYRGDDDDE